MTYLLDTSTWVAVLRNNPAHISAKVTQIGPAEIVLSNIVLAELYAGAFKSNHREENERLVTELTTLFAIVNFDVTAAKEYGNQRTMLARAGMQIGSNDLLIAATALAHHLVVVTHNLAEFSRVEGLQIEDWH